MFRFFKNHKEFLYLASFLILISCKLQEPDKSHGIIFLENRSNQLFINKTNKNDVIKSLGNPHSISFNNNNVWIYVERVLTKGEYHKLGQNVLKTNNVLILEFDKFGILINKDFLNKEDIKEIKFSQKKTENELTKRSFVQNFLQSLKQKMYGNR